MIYCRAEYPLAINRLEIAMDQAREKGYLGKNLFDSGFDFDLRIKAGAGAFVCGEETALIASLEGERGMPRLKPPFPAAKGYWQKPTDINNVETLANVPWIYITAALLSDPWVRKRSKGTKGICAGTERSKRAVWLRFLWVLRCVTLSSVSAAASKMTGSSRPFRWAVLPADVSRQT